MTKLQIQKVRVKDLVDNFQNSSEEYVKIRNIVEEKVVSIVSDRKMLLKLALLSLTESMRKDPVKYSSLMYNSTSSILKTPSTGYSSNQHYGATSSGQQRYPSLNYISTLLEESQKLYNKLAKELVDESINDYAYIILSSSLPFLPPANEEQKSSQTKSSYSE